MGQTVNLLVYTFGGSNPSSPTDFWKNPSSYLSNDKRFSKFILKEDKADEEGEREFTAIAIVGGPDTESAPLAHTAFPCGICRQVLAEFCSEDLPVIVARSCDDYEVYTLGELLPHAFTPMSLWTTKYGRAFCRFCEIQWSAFLQNAIFWRKHREIVKFLLKKLQLYIILELQICYILRNTVCKRKGEVLKWRRF